MKQAKELIKNTKSLCQKGGFRLHKFTSNNGEVEETCGSAAADFICRNFYVDDGLKSVPSVKQAKELIKNTKSLCQKGGFRLHKFTSNNGEVVNSVPEEDQGPDTKDHHLISDDAAVERALGVHWCIESDMLSSGS